MAQRYWPRHHLRGRSPESGQRTAVCSTSARISFIEGSHISHAGGASRRPYGRNAMTPEIIFLLWSAALTLLLALIAASAATLEVGLPRLAGNRENMPEMPGWAGRAARSHQNMLENLVLFAIVVFAA